MKFLDDGALVLLWLLVEVVVDEVESLVVVVESDVLEIKVAGLVTHVVLEGGTNLGHIGGVGKDGEGAPDLERVVLGHF